MNLQPKETGIIAFDTNNTNSYRTIIDLIVLSNDFMQYLNVMYTYAVWLSLMG